MYNSIDINLTMSVCLTLQLDAIPYDTLIVRHTEKNANIKMILEEKSAFFVWNP